MSTEKFTTNAVTTLNGAIDNSTTSVVVTSAASFPSTAQFRIRIDSELMLVTGVSSNTFTVTRGIEGTSAASHVDTSIVAQVFTAAGLKQILADNTQLVAYSGLPGAERAGRIILVNDQNNLVYDNGSALTVFDGVQKLTPPPVMSNWTWDNQNSATGADTNNTIVLSHSQGTGTLANQVIGLYKTAPSTPYTITAKFLIDTVPANFCGFCLFFRNSSSGKIAAYQINYASTVNGDSIWARKYTNSTTWSADYISGIPQRMSQWLRIEDDGTNRYYYLSQHGLTWKLIHSVGRTDFITADQVGFGLNPEKSASGVSYINTITLVSWAVS
jgi:hypothetical protein